ncbi:retropepsin-like aspartic protease [Ferrimonas marina]|uniref:Aspartyl protease n=1 Tax=Ferrimonas marina TaxID=299255 RepID=A0A1M5RXZ9_9GAMM|nr:retropepsin-like aspartic protease [Ferrimonas marina]SHH31237.1 Aspartyl protease [Ferrimonas marina]
MRHFLRPSLLVCLLLALPQNTLADSYPTPAAIKAARAADALGEQLEEMGYAVAPLTRMRSGHLVAEVKINGSEPMRFVCDSGSGATLITPQTSQRLQLQSEDTGSTAAGVGGQGLQVDSAEISSFQIGGKALPMEVILVVDISHVNAQFVVAGEQPIEGIIGSDWMKAHQVLLDVAHGRMFFKPI